jgi:hypothetical protein
MERQRFPLATERGRSILHRNSIVIASLLDMITENKPRSRQHRAEIERPKWAGRACRPLSAVIPIDESANDRFGFIKKIEGLVHQW